MPCPACKIIIDGGRLAAAADLLADAYTTDAFARASARYLSGIVRWNTNAITNGIQSGAIAGDLLDEAHAWSELQCHRAAAIEEWAQRLLSVNRELLHDRAINGPKLLKWAEEDRLHATKLTGGEYRGAWQIDGVKGITKRPL